MLPVSVVGRRRFHGNTHFAASDDAMADARDTLELFGVEVQELAWPPLVAHDRHRRIERGDTPAVIQDHSASTRISPLIRRLGSRIRSVGRETVTWRTEGVCSELE